MNDPKRYHVVDYYDLRPVDWLSGKRLPLEPGTGHTCDRCGAEHALVYVVEDGVTHKQYKVGSGCAKQSFGFDPSRDKDGRAIVSSKRKVDAIALNDHRLTASSDLAETIVRTIKSLPEPVVVLDREVTSKYAHFPGQKIRVFRAGDVEAEEWEQRGYFVWHDRQTADLAVYRWYVARVTEQIPSEWKIVPVYTNPNRVRASTTNLYEVCLSSAMKKLRKDNGP